MEPANPAAVFPQIAKPDIFDFRSHKMANGGYAAMHTFRKAKSENSIKTKYPTIVRTREEIDAEEQQALVEDAAFEDVEEEEELPKKKSQKNYTIDDIMQLDTSLTLSKKKEASKAIKKPEVRKQKKHAKRSQKIVKF